MIADVWAVIWKEWRELPAQRGVGGWLSLMVVVVFFGVILPLQIGSEWIQSPIVIFLSAWMPYIATSHVAADSFAGERERHTLETLLASRLSNHAILLGKVLVNVSYGWALTTLMLLLGLVTVNLAYGGGALLLYDQGVVWLALGPLGACLAASLGVLVSLRASTVRQAQLLLSIVGWLLPFAVGFGSRLLPWKWTMGIMQAAAGDGLSRIVAVVAVLLFLLDVALLCISMARFKRSRLILD